MTNIIFTKNKALFISLLSGCVDGSALVFIIFLVSLLVLILTQSSPILKLLDFLESSNFNESRRWHYFEILVSLTLPSTRCSIMFILYQISGNLPNWNSIQPDMHRLRGRCIGSTHDRNNFTISYKTCPPVVRRTGDNQQHPSIFKRWSGRPWRSYWIKLFSDAISRFRDQLHVQL